MKSSKTIAIIDIGSNSIRYFTAQSTKHGVSFSDKLRCTTRLATGLVQSGLLQAEPIINSYRAISGFCELARADGLPVYAYATSAVRDAKNRDEFLSLIKPLGMNVSVLSGPEEGHYAYLAACPNGGSLIDIGGGSTQLVTQDSAKSFPVGCVRARDYCPAKEYLQMKDKLFAWFSSIFDRNTPLPAPIVGVGGTISTLGALLLGQKSYDGTMFGNFSFSAEMLDELLNNLCVMGDNIKDNPLLVKRHDVIIQGGLIVLYLMNTFDIASIRPSEVDGMEGFAINKLAE